MINNSKLEKLKLHVIDEASKETFIHHEWYTDLHLKYVEEISLALCDKYKEARRDLVLALVWVHDYAKITGLGSDINDETKLEIKDMLRYCDMEEFEITEIIECLDIFERKMEIDLSLAPIEIQIVSSADGAAHMTGPFYSIYWKEYSTKSIEQLMNDNIHKLKKDWERKVVLPEIKQQFKDKYEFLSEMYGRSISL